MNPVSYLIWHFSKLPLLTLKITRNYLLFIEHFFSIRLLLKTLFYPWKRQIFDSGPGFSFSKFFEVVVSNLISRFLGAFIRLVLIILGIICQITVLIGGSLLTLLLICLPFMTLPIYYFITSKEDEKQDRQRLFQIIKSGAFFQLDNKELVKLNQTKAGYFLFSRLTLSEQELAENNFSSLVKKYLITQEDVLEIMRWYNHAKDEEEEYKRFWAVNNLLRVKPLGQDFSYGYTINLDKYASDLTGKGYAIPHLVGRREEIDRLQRILSRSRQNNALISGDPGSGRHAIILAFALDVFEGKVVSALKNKRVLELNLNLLISNASDQSQIKGVIDQVLQEAVQAGNIILVIDNFDRFVNNQKGVDLTDIFVKYFSADKLQLVAITDQEAYHQTILVNNSLMKILEVMEVKEISQEDTLKVLEHLCPILEKERKIFIPFLSLTYTIEKSKLIGNIPFPEKAVDVLENSALQANNKRSRLLTKEHINQVVAEMTKTPQTGLIQGEKEKLKNLEELLHRYVINQEQAIRFLAQSLRRARLDISDKGKPIGAFLFLGPTGVGKTETAKTLARVYFGSETQMVRIDMSQQQTNSSIQALLGNRETNTAGILTKAVRDTPFTVVLLDEIEKASKEVLNIFLTIIDEGYVTDSFAKKVDFTNTIIIGTSNAGSEFIRQYLEQKKDPNKLSSILTEHILKERIFSPEFINRFDAVVVYQPLSQNHLLQIARLMVEKLNQRLKKKKISVNISDSLLEQIVKYGYNPQFGAREMRRVIQEKVEDFIAKGLLDETIKSGETVDIPPF